MIVDNLSEQNITCHSPAYFYELPFLFWKDSVHLHIRKHAIGWMCHAFMISKHNLGLHGRSANITEDKFPITVPKNSLVRGRNSRRIQESILAKTLVIRFARIQVDSSKIKWQHTMSMEENPQIPARIQMDYSRLPQNSAPACFCIHIFAFTEPGNCTCT